ncbi:MAG: HflC protein [Chloroflexi bacterium]|nr:HflC protein [Chloroflexota bacterium]|tara:strand:- start:18707 stop:19639 length:933 start_codon:yes stop_codon:yes gene_type:complete
MKLLAPIVILIVAAFVLIPQALYKVDETEHIVLTRFGEIKGIQSTPGLKMKVPFIDVANVLDKRLLRVDVPRAGFPDIQSQFLDIDAYVRYRITDPRSFREVLSNEVTAGDRISNLVVAALREEVGMRDREEIIGGNPIDLADGTQKVEPIVQNGVFAREELTRKVRDVADARAKEQAFGISIVDVRIKRAEFPDSIVGTVFTRMRSEREIQANALRAQGEEQYLTKTADVDRRVEIIGAQADEKANRLRGEGEGQAISILADALEQDPEFFAFRRSLQAYSKILNDSTTLVLPADADLFKFLLSSQGSK